MVFGSNQLQKNIFSWDFLKYKNHGVESSLDLTTYLMTSTSFQGITVSPNGKKVFLIDGLKLYELVLITPWDVSTAVNPPTMITLTGSSNNGMSSENGLDWYFSRGGADQIAHFKSNKPWDISTMNLTEVDTYTMSNPSFSQPLDCYVNGHYIYVCGQVNELRLYDIKNGLGNAVLLWRIQDSVVTPSSQGIVVSPDGRTIILTRTGDQTLVIDVPTGFQDQGGNVRPTISKVRDFTGITGSSGNNIGITGDRITGTRFIISEILDDDLYSVRFK